MMNRKTSFASITGSVLNGLLALAFVGMGLSNYWQPGTMGEDIAKSGYPPHFFQILGIAQFIGAIVIALPRLPRAKEWAYSGMMFNLLAASHHHFIAGDGLLRITIPLILGAIVAASYCLRSPSRRLPGSWL